jgi:F0F1-type ATP synthase assembly protein I
MSDQPRPLAITAGFTLLGAVLFCAAIGVGIGLLAGSVPLFAIAGVFIGFGVGFGLVYTRFKHV